MPQKNFIKKRKERGKEGQEFHIFIKTEFI